MAQIYSHHLEFLEECKQAFSEDIKLHTFTNEDGSLIGLRCGADRDCIQIIELGEEIGLFAQVIEKPDHTEYVKSFCKYHDLDVSEVRPEVKWFAEEMERRLKANDHRGGWHDSTNEYLLRQIARNYELIKNYSLYHSDFQRRLANIANYAMMIADNDRRRQEIQHEN